MTATSPLDGRPGGRVPQGLPLSSPLCGVATTFREKEKNKGFPLTDPVHEIFPPQNHYLEKGNNFFEGRESKSGR